MDNDVSTERARARARTRSKWPATLLSGGPPYLADQRFGRAEIGGNSLIKLMCADKQLQQGQRMGDAGNGGREAERGYV